jgi:hypothetical protein
MHMSYMCEHHERGERARTRHGCVNVRQVGDTVASLANGTHDHIRCVLLLNACVIKCCLQQQMAVTFKQLAQNECKQGSVLGFDNGCRQNRHCSTLVNVLMIGSRNAASTSNEPLFGSVHALHTILLKYSHPHL